MGILLALIRIWVEHTQTLLVSYGLIAAGIAIALQDFFKNFVGGVIIFVTGIYRVGDRIELNAKIGEKYYLTARAVEPEIYLTLTDNWITFHIRYITNVRKRREIRNTLGKLILEEIRKSETVKIASATVDIVGFPELRERNEAKPF